MGIRALHLAVFGLCLGAAGSGARAQDSFNDAFWQFRATAGFDYSSGHYGADTATVITYSSTSFRADKGPWTFKAVLPWITLSGPAVLLDGAGGGSVGTGASRHESGLGDISLYGTYSLESLYSRGLFVDFTFRLKTPTASFSKGLGTGKPDEAFQIDAAQALGKFMPFVTAGYRVTGDPTGYNLRNIFYGTAGLQYSWSERIQTGAFFDYRQAALRTLADPRRSHRLRELQICARPGR